MRFDIRELKVDLAKERARDFILEVFGMKYGYMQFVVWAVVFAAFAGSLAVGLIVVLWLLGGLRTVTAPASIGGCVYRATSRVARRAMRAV